MLFPTFGMFLLRFIINLRAETDQQQDMVPALVDAIKSHGLALVTDKSSDSPNASPMTDPFPRPPKGVDGVLKSHGILRFNDSIDM